MRLVTRCVFFVLVWLTALSPISGELLRADVSAPLPDDGLVDVMFVIDNSGSMRKNDPAFLMPETVRTFLERLPDTTRAGMVLFDERARMLQALSDLSLPESRRRLTGSLDKVDYRGKLTDSAAGIERAAYELKTGGRNEARKSIIFLTDGIVDTGDRQKDMQRTQWLKTDLATDCSASGIRILGIAFTENADFPLIQALASRTGGTYFRAARAEDLADVLDRIQALLPPPPDPVTAAPAPLAAVPSSGPAATPAAAEAPDPARPAGETAAAPATGAMAEPDGSGSAWTFYLPLILIIFVLMGLVAMLVFKLFSLPAWLGGRKTSPAPMAAMNLPAPPEWELRDQNEGGGNIHRFVKARATVGRDGKNDLMLATPTVSNLHAIIEYREGAFFLEDQRSTNGTRLNDHQVPADKPMRLKSGDRIRFANLAFKFVRLDQIVSGDTVMLEITTIDTLPDEADDLTRDQASEKSLQRCLEGHVDQIRLLGEKFKAFADACFPGEMCSAIAIQACENMEHSRADQGQHCSPLIKGNAFYVICTLPVAASAAVGWFGEHHGGFSRFILSWIRSDGYDVTACDQFCVITFGTDIQPWVSMTVVPTHEDPDPVEIMSVNFLTDEEKADLGLAFDDHGRVL